jgi:hypothetical protein
MKVPVPKVKAFKVGGDELDLDWLLKHDFDDIREASELLPAAMAWLGWQRAYYKEQLYIAEVAIKTVKAKLYFKYREHGLESDGFSGKPTETAIEHAINVHEDLAAQHALAAKFERVVCNLAGYIDALNTKVELVRTSEATHRKVTEHEPLSDEELTSMAQTKTEGE